MGVEQGGHAGLKQESAAFAQAASLDTHKALVHIFFAQRATKKVSRQPSSLSVLVGNHFSLLADVQSSLRSDHIGSYGHITDTIHAV